MQLLRIAIDPERARSSQLVLAIAAAEQPDAEHSRPTPRQKVPYRIADDVAFIDRDTEPLLAVQKEIGSRLRAKDIASLDDDRLRSDPEDLQRTIDLRPPAGRGDPVRHARGAKSAQKLDGAGKRPALRQKLTEELTMPPLEALGLVRGQVAAKLPRDRTREQPAAHSDPPMNPPPIDRQLRLRQRPLPCEHVGIDGVDKGAIQIENQSGHNSLRVSSYSPHMENAPQSPRLADLISILYRPRETMRRILDSGRPRWGVQVVMLAAVCASVNNAATASLPDADLPQIRVTSLIAIVGLGMIGEAIAWAILLYIVAWIATPIGRLLGGTAKVADLRAALGWGMTPVVWSPIYRIPLLIFASGLHIGPKPDVHKAAFDFISRGGCSIIVVYLFLQAIFAIACFVVASFTVAEAQRFSTQKGFVNVIVTLLLPLLVTFAAVFTLRS